jgi:hypothetical protein
MAVSSTDSQQRIWQVTNLGWFLPGRLPSSSVIETRGFKTCLYVPSFREDVLRRGTLTPSSRRRCHHPCHLLCRRLCLPLRLLLPRLALVEREHWQLPTDQKSLGRGILDVFCSCPMVRPVPLGKRGHSQYPTRKTARTRARPEGRLIKPYHRTSDIVYLNAETLGWDRGVHSCRPRQLCDAHSRCS